MREVDLETFATAYAGGAQVIDVREISEYVDGHVPGAAAIPMGQLAARMDELDREGRIYVICQTGSRSLVMTDLLQRAGFDAVSVADGTAGWIRSGRPVNRGVEK